MGKRLYLAKGYIAGTLTKEEEIEAKNNPIVMKEAENLQNRKAIKPKTKRTVKKNGR